MSTAHHCSSLALCCSLLLTLIMRAQNQTPTSPQKLSLTAALVLTPEFCATVSKKGGEKFPVGQVACTELEPVLKGIFTSLTRVDDSSKAGEAQVVLEPKFADVSGARTSFNGRDLSVLVDWTARDQSGKAVWIETVQGSAKSHMGNAFTHNSNLKHLVENSVQNMAEQSAAKMSASPQLLKMSVALVK
jgi:hypothetical protein